MRSIISLFLILVFSFSASAGLMKQHMKEMGRHFKKISSTMRDTSQNEANAALAAQIVVLLSEVYTEVPDTILELPEERQAEAFAHYQDLTQQVYNLGQQLEQAFLANDNNLAVQIYKQMKNIMEDGHDKYEPQD